MRSKPTLHRRAKRRHAQRQHEVRVRAAKIEARRAAGLRLVTVTSPAGISAAYNGFMAGRVQGDVSGILNMVRENGISLASLLAANEDLGAQGLQFEVKDDPEEIMLFMLKVGQ